MPNQVDLRRRNQVFLRFSTEEEKFQSIHDGLFGLGSGHSFALTESMKQSRILVSQNRRQPWLPGFATVWVAIMNPLLPSRFACMHPENATASPAMRQ